MLEKQIPRVKTRWKSSIDLKEDQSVDTTSSDHSMTETRLPQLRPGEFLSPSAVARFERLRDRIDLYALSELKACIAEKEALVGMVWKNDSHYNNRPAKLTLGLQPH
jgi:hypothetical protein